MRVIAILDHEQGVYPASSILLLAAIQASILKRKYLWFVLPILKYFE